MERHALGAKVPLAMQSLYGISRTFLLRRWAAAREGLASLLPQAPSIQRLRASFEGSQRRGDVDRHEGLQRSAAWTA